MLVSAISVVIVPYLGISSIFLTSTTLISMSVLLLVVISIREHMSRESPATP